jgi:hypothetical protein
VYSIEHFHVAELGFAHFFLSCLFKFSEQIFAGPGPVPRVLRSLNIAGRMIFIRFRENDRTSASGKYLYGSGKWLQY